MVFYLDASGATTWARRHGSTDIDHFGDATVDASGNVYAVGSFRGTVDFGDGPRTATGSADAVFVSYDPAGTLRWVRQGAGDGLDKGLGIDLDASGNVVATGSWFGASADYGGATLLNAGGYDAWIVRYRGSDGLHLWSQAYSSTADEDGYDIASSPSGSVVVAGVFDGSLSAGGMTVSTAGGRDVFVMSVRP